MSLPGCGRRSGGSSPPTPSGSCHAHPGRLRHRSPRSALAHGRPASCSPLSPSLALLLPATTLLLVLSGVEHRCRLGPPPPDHHRTLGAKRRWQSRQRAVAVHLRLRRGRCRGQPVWRSGILHLGFDAALLMSAVACLAALPIAALSSDHRRRLQTGGDAVDALGSAAPDQRKASGSSGRNLTSKPISVDLEPDHSADGQRRHRRRRPGLGVAFFTELGRPVRRHGQVQGHSGRSAPSELKGVRSDIAMILIQ